MDAATEQAIDWLVRLDSDHADDAVRLAFDRWLQAHEAHRQAWSAVQARLGGSVDAAIGQLCQEGAAASVGRQALLAPVPTAASRRRMLRGGLATLLATTATGWLVNRQTPLTTLAADLRTGTGQRLHHRLPDDSELTLDARSAVDIAYDGTRRLVRLHAGALVASVAPLGHGRPFVVQTAQGTVQALGTRFMVRQVDDGAGEYSLVHVMEHSVRIANQAGQTQVLQAGESARFSGETITVLGGRIAPDAWAQGLIDVRDQPLAEVIDALRPYTAGLIRVSPEAARVRVFGVFALDAPERVLQDLADTHPITVRRWGPWLTLVDVRKISS